MKPDTRWFDWQPSTEKFEKSQELEPSKNTKIISEGFEGSLSAQNQNFLPPEADPSAYESGFDRWAASRCVFRDRCWGGIGALHVDYARWCDQHGREVPASRRTFERILLSQGLWREEDLREGLIYGLLLKEDWEARPKAALEVLESTRKKPAPRVPPFSGQLAAGGR